MVYHVLVLLFRDWFPNTLNFNKVNVGTVLYKVRFLSLNDYDIFLRTAMNSRRTRLRIKALKRLWEFCQGVTSCIVTEWRLVIGKLGRFSRNELRGNN